MSDQDKKIVSFPIIQVLYLFLSCMVFNFVMLLLEQNGIGGAIGFLVWHRNYFFKSYVLILLFFGVVYFFSSIRLSAILTGTICFLFAFMNVFKIQYRGEPLLPWDIYSISEASQVVSTLNFEISVVHILCLFLTVGVIFASFFIPDFPFKNKKTKFISGIIIGFTSMFLLIFTINHNYIRADEWPDPWFRIEYYNQHGLLNSFLYNFRYLSIEEPEGYSKKLVETICDDLEKQQIFYEANNKKETPTIIFIMSESLWDASTLPGITFDKKLLPNIISLQKEGIRGQILSPKFGGGTSNVEFEALTGFTNDTLPDGCIPYQQYISEDFFSVAQFLKQKGYDTLAIHSDLEKNWNRANAYPNMGFDDFISSEDMINPQMLRGRISDFAVTKEIIQQYEKHKQESENPWFNFTVTVQNHTGYCSDHFSEQERFPFYSEKPLSKEVEDQLSDYVTGIHASDQALGELVTYFSRVNEPVLILFFGDHRTNLGNEEYQVFYETNAINKNMDPMEIQYFMHLTPFLAWSNQDNISKDIGVIAPYQIIPSVFHIYGLEMPRYFMFLNQLKEVSSGSHLGMVLDENGIPSKSMTPEQKKLYYYYEVLQYDMVIGEGYGKQYLFERSK